MYDIKIIESSRDFTAREKLLICHTETAKKIDEAIKTTEDSLIITPVDYALIEIHNDKFEEANKKDYEQIIIIDDNGERFVTGSMSFIENFMNIFFTMKDEDEKYQVKIYKRDSKNFKDKQFITCEIV